MRYDKNLRIAPYTNGEFEIVKVLDPEERPYACNVSEFDIIYFRNQTELAELLKTAGKDFVKNLIEELKDEI